MLLYKIWAKPITISFSLIYDDSYIMYSFMWFNKDSPIINKQPRLVPFNFVPGMYHIQADSIPISVSRRNLTHTIFLKSKPINRQEKVILLRGDNMGSPYNN